MGIGFTSSTRARAWHCFHGTLDTEDELMPAFRQWLLRDGLHCMPELGTQDFQVDWLLSAHAV